MALYKIRPAPVEAVVRSSTSINARRAQCEVEACRCIIVGHGETGPTLGSDSQTWKSQLGKAPHRRSTFPH